MKIISHVSIIYKSISISVYSSLYVFCIIMIKSYHFSVLCFSNICLLLLIFIMYPYSCYASSIVYICKYCVCPHGPYDLLDVGIKVSIYIKRQLIQDPIYVYLTRLFILQPEDHRPMWYIHTITGEHRY